MQQKGGDLKKSLKLCRNRLRLSYTRRHSSNDQLSKSQTCSIPKLKSPKTTTFEICKN